VNTDRMIIESRTARSARGDFIKGVQVFIAHNRDGVHAYGTPAYLMELFPHAHATGSAASAASIIHREDQQTGLCIAKECWRHTEGAFSENVSAHWSRRLPPGHYAHDRGGPKPRLVQ